MTEMSHRLCNRGVDVDGEVSAVIEEDITSGEKVRFRIVVRNVVVAIGSSQDDLPKQPKDKKDRQSSIWSRFTAKEYSNEFQGA